MIIVLYQGNFMFRADVPCLFIKSRRTNHPKCAMFWRFMNERMKINGSYFMYSLVLIMKEMLCTYLFKLDVAIQKRSLTVTNIILLFFCFRLRSGRFPSSDDHALLPLILKYRIFPRHGTVYLKQIDSKSNRQP